MNESGIDRQTDHEQLEDADLDQPGDRDVRGDHVTVTRGSAREIHATQVIVRQGGVQQIKANEVKIRQGGVVYVQGQDVTIAQGGVVLAQTDALVLDAASRATGVLANQVTVDQGMTQMLVSKGEVTVDQSIVGMVMAPHVRLEHSQPLLLLAQHIHGDVKPVFGPAASAIFGAAFGIAVALIWLFLPGRKS
jgi:hypothetical protein